MFNKNTALIRIDLQKTFMPNGGLPIEGGDEIIPGINELTEQAHREGALIVDTQDWHPAGHQSLASTHGLAPYSTIMMPYGMQTLWPDHAIAGTPDAEFHPDLNTDLTHVLIRKGTNPLIDSYSAFTENDNETTTGLAALLKARGITHVVLVGLAYDFCVGYSAIDARMAGFNVTVLKSLCRSVNLPDPDNGNSVAAMEKSFAQYRITVQL